MCCIQAGPLTGTGTQQPPTELQALQISEAGLLSLLGTYPQGKEEAPEEPFLNFYEPLQATLFPQALIN